jgi:mevalonate kinase
MARGAVAGASAGAGGGGSSVWFVPKQRSRSSLQDTGAEFLQGDWIGTNGGKLVAAVFGR